MSTFAFQVEQTDILPTDMIFTLKRLPNLGHVVMLKNSSEVAASPVLDYIHSFSQEDINLSRVFYVSASLQVSGYFLSFCSPKSTCFL